MKLSEINPPSVEEKDPKKNTQQLDRINGINRIKDLQDSLLLSFLFHGETEKTEKKSCTSCQSCQAFVVLVNPVLW